MLQLENVKIRKAVLNDLPKMLQIMDEALESTTVDDEKEEQLKLWTIKFNNISQFIFYVAEIEHENLVGWCRGGQTVELHKIVDHQAYDCEILNIFILPKYQHHGIGRKLWKTTWNDILVSFQPKNFVVWSVDKEQAHKFYLSLGGIPKEKKQFTEDSIHTAFVWNDLTLYDSSNL